jgi:hypothetical protein
MIRYDIQYVDKDGSLTQAGWQMLAAMERRLAAAEALIAAAAAVANAAGGATVDAEARAQLAAIKVALTG